MILILNHLFKVLPIKKNISFIYFQLKTYVVKHKTIIIKKTKVLKI